MYCVMSVLKRGGSQFWYVQFQYNGRTYIKSSKSTDRKIAEVLEANWKKQLMTQQVLGIRNRLLLVDAFDLYMEAKRGLPSFRNIVRYVKTLNQFLTHRRHIDEVTTGDLERLKTHLTNDDYSAHHRGSILTTPVTPCLSWGFGPACTFECRLLPKAAVRRHHAF